MPTGIGDRGPPSGCSVLRRPCPDQASGESGSPPPRPAMIVFFKFPAYALIPLSGVRFLCRLRQVIAGWVVWSVSVFLSVLQKEHFSDKIVFMHFKD